ncbi:MAG: prepilin-type N-terminal cleavage/methylation domain-containing protein [Candidatus Omnitrophota bacterium]
MSKKAFTLVELIMVMLIVGILSIAIINDIASSLASTNLEVAKWKLITDIHYAQNLAVTQQIEHGVIFNPGSSTYSVYSQNTTNIVQDPLTNSPFTVNFANDTSFQGVTFTSPTFGNRLEFDNLGAPSDGTTPLASDGTITLSRGTPSAVITITKNTGKVK